MPNIHNKILSKPIVQKNFIEEILINNHKYTIHTDNRTKSSRVDVHNYQIGELHKPWYFYGDKNHKEMPNKDTNNVSLLYDVKDFIFDLNKVNIGFTSFYFTPKSKGMDYLVDTLAKEEQKELIICEKHFSKNANNLKFKKNFFQKNSELDDLRVYEGHHRVVALKKLNQKAHVRVYYSYNIDGPDFNISKHYNSPYTKDLWNLYKDIFNKDIAQPWFKLSDFKNLELTPKYNILMECIKFAKSLDIKIDNGLDIGCAEGAYTYLFSNKLGVSNMTGLDSEPARIIRGYLAKYFFNLKNINFRTDLIENFKYDNYDFISCLSVTHHLKDPMKTMEKICKNKKLIILENRVKNNTDDQKFNIENVCSIKDFIDEKFTDELANKLNMNYKFIGNEGDRYFYVLYIKKN